MNDFTKDELLIIHLDMCTYVEQNKILKESPIHKELRLKIQSMIDNYCEHEHIPNEETDRAIEEARNGEGIAQCKNIDDIFDNPPKGINLVCGKCKMNVNSFRIRFENKQQAYICTAFCHGEKEIVHEDAFLDLNLNGTFFNWNINDNQ